MTDGLKEIAARAGVSMSTVSRFVAGKSIRPALRLRVEAALYDAGHRRIVGLFTRAPVFGARRRMGYAAAMAELGLPTRTLVVGHGPAAQRATAETALDRWPDLDVLIAGNSPGMFAAARTLKERGHPATLAGFDRADWLHLLDRPTFWIEQPTVEIAHAMVALLLDPPSAGSSRHLVFQGIVRQSP